MANIVSDTDRARIEQAVRAAEARTSAEFVCVVMRQAGEWEVFPLLWAALAALALPWPLAMFTDWPIQYVHGAQLLFFVALSLVLSVPTVRNRVIPRPVARRRAHQRACEQFMVRGLGATEGRTGILVFVALAERYACVMPDHGIEKALPEQVWKDAVVRLTDALRAGRPADGLVAAVALVADALAAHAPPRDGDADELSNRLIEL